MSWHYLQEQEGESSEVICSDGEPLPPLRSKITHAAFYSNGKLTDAYLDSLSGTTFAHSTESRGVGKSTSLAEDSHAKTSAQPGEEQDLQESEAGFGLKWPESSAKFDPDSCSWKIHPCLFPEDSMSCLVTLPKWGTMRSGVLSERTMPALRTSGTGSGLLANWPTPTSSEGSKIPDRANYGQIGLSNHPRIVGYPTRPKLKKDRKGVDGGVSTPQKFPTPNARDWKGKPGPNANQRESSLPTVVGEDVKTVGKLNPNWVEWLMGWPIGWTDLKPLETGKFQSWPLSPSKSCPNDYERGGIKQ